MSGKLLDNKGQTLTEYAFTFLFITLVVFVILGYFGGSVFNKYSHINSSFPK